MYNSPPFRRLVSLRNKVHFTLAALVVATHAFFVGGTTFCRDLFTQAINQGGTITVGIVASVTVIVAMLLLQWAYITISSKYLDSMQKEVAKSVPIIILTKIWPGLTTRGGRRFDKKLVAAELASDIKTFATY